MKRFENEVVRKMVNQEYNLDYMLKVFPEFRKREIIDYFRQLESEKVADAMNFVKVWR